MKRVVLEGDLDKSIYGRKLSPYGIDQRPDAWFWKSLRLELYCAPSQSLRQPAEAELAVS
jgi:hypothetical protein